jgi:tRNA(His) 5'-end guanylyltransferase
MKNDEFGDRMKRYESVETRRRLDLMQPVYARIDGRCFSSFTHGMERPFDSMMSGAMIEVTSFLVEETHARIGYTQSDEISLCWLAETPETPILFDGKIQKMVSVLASIATARFLQLALQRWPEKCAQTPPTFDCRVFQLPTREEAANAFLWRAQDATKNAISMAARSHFSAKALHGKSGFEMKQLLADKDIDFNDYPPAFRLGTFLRRTTIERPLSEEERRHIPEKHRPVPGTLFQRSHIATIEMPPFHQVANRTQVIFDSAEPMVRESD